MKHLKTKVALSVIMATLLTVVACNKKSDTPVAAKKNGQAEGVKTESAANGAAVATVGNDYKVVLTPPSQIGSNGVFGVQIQSLNGQVASTEAAESVSLRYGAQSMTLENTDESIVQDDSGKKFHKVNGYIQLSNGKFALYYETRCLLETDNKCSRVYVTTWLFQMNKDGSFQNMTDAQLGFLYLAGYEQEPVTAAADRGTSISMDDMVIKLDNQFNSVLNSSF